MPRRRLITATTVTILLLMLATAAWVNSCFQDSNGRVLVVEGSSVVGNGKCRAVTGYFNNNSFVLRGAVCGNTAGMSLRFGLDYSDSFAGILGTDAFALDRQTLAGLGYIYTAGASAAGFHISKIACPATVLQ